MQKLYSFAYPCKDIAKADELYIRGDKYNLDLSAQEILLQNGGYFDTCTFYNAFSIEKWRKYTTIHSLFLQMQMKGHIRLRIYTKYVIAGDYLNKLILDQSYFHSKYENIEINLTEILDQTGLLYFEVYALDSNCGFRLASYSTEENFERISVGAVICTFKREQYIDRLIRNFETCTSRENLQIFISDNGNTLPAANDPKIHIFPNKNYGGAGGFCRGMFEIQKYNNNSPEENKIDYILLMDDDIVVDFNIFEKLVSFLSLKASQYDNYFLAGSMCSLDYPYLQYEKFSSWRGNHFVQLGAGADLRDINTIVANEREEHLNNCSAGWWFSCFSTKIIKKNNYPFPCFFRGDDIEFTIRNGSKIITLNGINVWHEPFYKKYSITSENYYLFRNTMVINALYFDNLGSDFYIKYLFKRFAVSIILYDYRSAELLIKAWQDFGKGIRFFKETDPEDLNTELRPWNYKSEPIENILEEFRYDDINKEIYGKQDKNKWTSFIRHITINGFLIPKCFYKEFGLANTGFAARYINFYCKKKVLNIDPFTWTGYITEVDKKKAITLTLKFVKQALWFKRNFRHIKKDYQGNFRELQTEEFWKKYLDI